MIYVLEIYRQCKINCIMHYFSLENSSVGERPAPRGGTTLPGSFIFRFRSCVWVVVCHPSQITRIHLCKHTLSPVTSNGNFQQCASSWCEINSVSGKNPVSYVHIPVLYLLYRLRLALATMLSAAS